jgi:large subunit ribosomal protein L24
MKLKAQDQVKVLSGKDKGKTGKIMKIYRKQGKVVVEKVNIRTKHVKKTQQRAGEIIKFEASIDASNVMVVCPQCKKPTRVGYKKSVKGKKERVCKKCSETLDTITKKTK